MQSATAFRGRRTVKPDHGEILALRTRGRVEIDGVVEPVRIGVHDEATLDAQGLMKTAAGLERGVRWGVFTVRGKGKPILRPENVEMSIPAACGQRPRRARYPRRRSETVPYYNFGVHQISISLPSVVCKYAYYDIRWQAMSKAPVKLRHSPPDLHERPGFLVRRANQILMSLAEQETAKIGLTPPQHVHLLALGRWGALDQITLGKALGIDRATVGQVVGRLEARGLLQRKLDPKDGRRRIVALTSRGRDLLKPANAAALNVSERLLAALDQRERKEIVRLLTKLVTALADEAPTIAEPVAATSRTGTGTRASTGALRARRPRKFAGLTRD